MQLSLLRISTLYIISLTVFCYGRGVDAQVQFHITTKQEASEELLHPKAEYPPTNAEIVARYDAINPVMEYHKSGCDMLRLFSGEYDKYLRLFGSVSNESKEDNLLSSSRSNLERLQWQVSIPETVSLCEPIPVEIKLENISDKEIVIRSRPLYPPFYLYSIKLTRADSKEQVKISKRGLQMLYNGWATSYARISGTNLKPGEEYAIKTIGPFRDNLESGTGCDLTKAYDLSEPGEYELTFYTRRFLDENGEPAEDQEREYPRKTTVRFTILPKSEETSPESK